MSVKLLRTGAILALIAAAVFMVSFYINTRADEYVLEAEVAGVPVKSTIPLSELKNWRDVRLYEAKNNEQLACNLMLRAINQQTQYGVYSVTLEDGPKGITLKERSATLSGSAAGELLESCNAFACLISGIDCPNNLFYAKGFGDAGDTFRLVFDANASSSGVSAYTELVGVLSFLQAKRADYDKNGKVDEGEIQKNTVRVTPYTSENGVCTKQPLNNLLQKTERTNETVDCSVIRGIHIKEGGANAIQITADDKITLEGDEDHLLVEAIILGNVMAPDWITALNTRTLAA